MLVNDYIYYRNLTFLTLESLLYMDFKNMLKLSLDFWEDIKFLWQNGINSNI